MSFKDKVAIVTGASSGIGAAIAIKYASEGARVTIVARNEKKLNEIARKCREKGGHVLTMVADLTVYEDIKKIVSETVKNFGGIDIVINNAGICSYVSVSEPNALEQYDKMLATNLRAAVALVNLASPFIINAKGSVVNISSVASTTTSESTGFAYKISKAGLDHFTRCIARDLGQHGVRANTINPGPVKTDIVKNFGVSDPRLEEEVWDHLKEGNALKRVSDPDEIADMALFLTSEKGRGITGASIFIDNGVRVRLKM